MTESFDWDQITDDISSYLRLVPTPVGLKFCGTSEELQSIPGIRLSDDRFSVCQGIGRAVLFGWTVGIQKKNIHADYCRVIHGMADRDEKFVSGRMFADIWFEPGAAKKHHQSMYCLPNKYIGIAVSPLRTKRLNNVDVCVLYANSGQMFILLSGFLYSDFRKLQFTFSGESACNDTWVRTMLTGRPYIALPSYAERKFGMVSDNEISLSITPQDLVKALEGVKILYKNGLRYPIAPYGLTVDIMGGLPKSYFEY